MNYTVHSSAIVVDTAKITTALKFGIFLRTFNTSLLLDD